MSSPNDEIRAAVAKAFAADQAEQDWAPMNDRWSAALLDPELNSPE